MNSSATMSASMLKEMSKECKNKRFAQFLKKVHPEFETISSKYSQS